MKLYHLVEDAENKGLTEKEAEIEILNITANVSDVRDGSLFVAEDLGGRLLLFLIAGQ